LPAAPEPQHSALIIRLRRRVAVPGRVAIPRLRPTALRRRRGPLPCLRCRREHSSCLWPSPARLPLTVCPATAFTSALRDSLSASEVLRRLLTQANVQPQPLPEHCRLALPTFQLRASTAYFSGSPGAHRHLERP